MIVFSFSCLSMIDILILGQLDKHGVWGVSDEPEVHTPGGLVDYLGASMGYGMGRDMGWLYLYTKYKENGTPVIDTQIYQYTMTVQFWGSHPKPRKRAAVCVLWSLSCIPV